MNLHRLVYHSRSRVPEADALATEVQDILAASQRNNVGAGVTGVLMLDSSCFAQVLEGDRDAVEATFERIQQDERHGELSLLAFGPVHHRVFGLWPMGFVGAFRGDADGFAATAAEGGFDPALLAGDSVFQLLKGLAPDDQEGTSGRVCVDKLTLDKLRSIA